MFNFQHVLLLLSCAGPEAIEEYSHFVYNEGEEKENYANVSAGRPIKCQGTTRRSGVPTGSLILQQAIN